MGLEAKCGSRANAFQAAKLEVRKGLSGPKGFACDNPPVRDPAAAWWAFASSALADGHTLDGYPCVPRPVLPQHKQPVAGCKLRDRHGLPVQLCRARRSRGCCAAIAALLPYTPHVCHRCVCRRCCRGHCLFPRCPRSRVPMVAAAAAAAAVAAGRACRAHQTHRLCILEQHRAAVAVWELRLNQNLLGSERIIGLNGSCHSVAGGRGALGSTHAYRGGVRPPPSQRLPAPQGSTGPAISDTCKGTAARLCRLDPHQRTRLDLYPSHEGRAGAAIRVGHQNLCPGLELSQVSRPPCRELQVGVHLGKARAEGHRAGD